MSWSTGKSKNAWPKPQFRKGERVRTTSHAVPVGVVEGFHWPGGPREGIVYSIRTPGGVLEHVHSSNVRKY